MIGVHLDDEIVEIIPVVIVEVGKVALFAPSSPRPRRTVEAATPLRVDTLTSVSGAPGDYFLSGVLVGEPGVM